MDSIPRQVLVASLRADLPFFAIACVAFAVGISALLLAHSRSRDRLLLWVGCFSVVYAVRLFIQNDLVRDVLTISDQHPTCGIFA